MLKLVNIKKDYKVANSKVRALKGVSLCFRENEFVGILGQSGCGKTTLLNIIGGLDHYTEGDLVIDGKSTKDFSDREWDVYRNHRIGFIFQSYNLIPHQTVLGNVELALTIAGVSREERVARAKQALERVGLGAEMNKRPNQLSGGQMQRVAIARALVNNPAILLADEPTGALDSKTSVEVMDLIREIAGERLVIMVTHNPELAEEYATRIVRLKDGEIESDSNPYSEEEEEKDRLESKTFGEPAPKSEEKTVSAETPVVETPAEAVPAATKAAKKRKPRAKMGALTALALSFRNLLTKKGRTILTSIGGSIGIISVCLVLALSNGFNHYIKKTEEDMLSYYPVRITESSYDMATAITSFTSPKDMPDLSNIGDKVYIDSFLINLGGNMTVKNNISEEYLDYIDKLDSNLYSAIQYGYGTSVVDNLFTNVDTLQENEDGSKLVPTTRSLSNIKDYYIGVVRSKAPDYADLVGFADFFANIVHRMPNTSDLKAADFGSYVTSQYDVVQGHFPRTENEVVLVVGKNNEVSDLTLAQLGLLDENKFVELFKKGEGGNGAVLDENSTVDFSDILGKKYTLFYNDTVYQKNYEGEWNQADSFTGKYPFSYDGRRTAQADGENPLTAKEGEGINLEISGILRLKEGRTYGCLQPGLNLTEQLIDTYVEKNMSSQIVNWLKNDAKFSIPSNTPGIPEKFLNREFWLSPSLNLNISIDKTSGYFSQVSIPNMTCFVSIDGETVIRALGGDKTVTSVSIYATDFDKKEIMLDYLDEWNNTHEDKSEQITYSDTVGTLMGMMQTMLNAITYVLVAFTAISLVVSSVMIGIITYVSVVERVKEIGVLRSLGASKQDIRNLFNSETFMIGLTAGVIGVVVSYLLSFVINAILNPLTGIAGLASLNPVAALVMVAISVVLTLISGLIPASAAAKKDPVIALRTE